MTPADKKAFKQELRELLLKYKATIQFNVGEGSDTYGLHGEHMAIYADGEVLPGNKWPAKELIFSTNDWYIDANDLK